MGNVQQYIGKRVEVGRYQVEAIKYLGEGGSSYIFLVKDVQRESARPMVLKRLVAENETTMALLQNEIEMHQRFHHPQIVEFHASQVIKKGKEREVLILMEYCPQGHLFENMTKMGEKRFKEQDLLRIFRSLCVPVRILHQCDPPVAHRDLKLENFLMAQNGTYKLCDFGSCVNGPQSLETKADRAREEEHVLKRTTAMYRSPELADVEGTAMFGQGQLTEAVDIWAMGCVLFTMCFFKPPFPPEGLRTERYTIPKESPYSPAVHQLIGRMLQGDVERRATIDHVIECCDELLEGRPLPKWNGPSPPSPVKKTTAPPPKPIAQEPSVAATTKTTEKRTADKSDLLDMDFNPTISSAPRTKVNDPFGASDPFSTSSAAGWATITAPPLSPNSGFANFDAFASAPSSTNNTFGFGQPNSFPTQTSHPPTTGFNATPAPTTPIPASFDAFDAIANPVKSTPPTMGFGAMPTQTPISPSARNTDPFAGLNSGMGMGMNMGTSGPGHQGFHHPHQYQQQPMGQQQWASHPPPPPQQQYGQGFSR